MKIEDVVIRNIEYNDRYRFVATYKGYYISVIRDPQEPYKGQYQYNISVKNDKNGTDINFSKSCFIIKHAIVGALREANLI